MKIAVLSGKGGTGKTLVSVNLAAVAERAAYYDCDVEEPNGHLYFKAQKTEEEIVSVKTPEVDAEKCIGCRKCMDFCQFNAIACIQEKAVVFPDVCHPCGGCTLVCQKHAITEIQRPIGKILRGTVGSVKTTTGMLRMGEESGVPIIRTMLKQMKNATQELVIVDCPPGSACVVMESILDVDYCILVTEPTIFGVHNLHMVKELVELFKKPYGVVINKCIDENNPAERFCLEERIPILGKISFDRQLGIWNSNTEIISAIDENYRMQFLQLLQKVKEVASDEAIADFER